eukprot:2046531-Pyramimonas_sp.AAC.2
MHTYAYTNLGRGYIWAWPAPQLATSPSCERRLGSPLQVCAPTRVWPEVSGCRKRRTQRSVEVLKRVQGVIRPRKCVHCCSICSSVNIVRDKRCIPQEATGPLLLSRDQ